MNTKKIITLNLWVLLLFSSNCQESKTKTTSSTLSSQEMSINSENQRNDYIKFNRLKIYDRIGFGQPVEAMALMLPEGWKSEGEIIWIPQKQPCAGNNMYFNAQSADNKFHFNILPNYAWMWSQNPQMNAISQQQSGQFCGVGEPMDAEHFITQVWSKEFGPDTQISDLKVSTEGIQTMGKDDQKIRSEMMSYGVSNMQFNHSAVSARVKMANGVSGILFCKVTQTVIQLPNKYNGTMEYFAACTSSRMAFTFPEEEKEKGEEMMAVIMASIRTNPDWKNATDEYWKGVRYRGQQEHIGRIMIQDERTRMIAQQAIKSGNERLAQIDQQTRSWESKQASLDRTHSDFIKTIRGVENYQDATGKVELESGYNHVWSRSDGQSYIMTNSPNVNPSSIFQDSNWKEMKKVD